MALPRTTEARPYYRAAKQRYDDAKFLLEAGRTTGAVYLAGYAVECILKALILDNVGSHLRRNVLGDFGGSRAHSIEWLTSLYRRHVMTMIPKSITQHLARVASWSTDLRYASGFVKSRDADEFIESVDAVMTWADGRM